ncbi:ABC transporter B family member 9 [Forsythia ovata]|uniref:ABC transporter B family member 9 n=1 Tax=Forsythia ovata TaxID=205694 RepID=A0ABD1S1L7_9LAMI
MADSTENWRIRTAMDTQQQSEFSIAVVLIEKISCFWYFEERFKVMYEEASQVANDAVSSIRTVASFSAEEKVMKMYEQKCKAPVKQGVRIGLVSGAGFGAGSFALFCTNSFCFYIGAVLIQHGKASFGDVFMVFFALTMSAIVVSQTSAMAPDVNKAKSNSNPAPK